MTTDGTGISARDVTPEATQAVLSRAVAGTRGKTLIVNLPGKPSAVRECLEILAPAIREGVAHLRGEDPH